MRRISCVIHALPPPPRPVGDGFIFRAKAVLEAIRVAIDEGCSARLLQKTPHVVLLSRKFYHEKLMPLLAQWVLLWMRQRRLREVSDEVGAADRGG